MVLFDMNNKKYVFGEVSLDLTKNKKLFSYLEESTISINNKTYSSLITTKWSSYIFYQNNWFRYINDYNTSLKTNLQLWTAPNIGRRLTTLNKFFEEGELS
jgi:hypothetical protein